MNQVDLISGGERVPIQVQSLSEIRDKKGIGVPGSHQVQIEQSNKLGKYQTLRKKE